METDLVINDEIIIPASELIITASRSSGPGGQHVNKTSSRISIRWNILNSKGLNDIEKKIVMNRLQSRLVGGGEILIHVESERSQLRNKDIAKERLAELVRKALIPKKKRLATKPSMGSKIKRLANKKKRGQTKKLRSSKQDIFS